jgi:hypothetical protein
MCSLTLLYETREPPRMAAARQITRRCNVNYAGTEASPVFPGPSQILNLSARAGESGVSR